MGDGTAAGRTMTTTDEIDAAIAATLEWGEVGVQVAAYLNGELLVDAWAGVADGQTDRRVDGDTLFCPFSVTKAITATALNLQVERGLVDFDRTVASYWPEFAANGKGQMTVGDMITHRGGIPQMPDDVTPDLMADWDWMVEQFAAMEPMFEPGTTNAYHGISWGWPIGEIVHRTDPKGRSFAEFAREEVMEPLGMTDTYFGLPDEQFPRYAPLVGDVGQPQPDPNPVRARAVPTAVILQPWTHNLPVVLKSVHPSAGVITSARSLARLFGMIASRGEFDGVRLLPEPRVDSFLVPRENDSDIDVTNDFVMSISSCGYWLASPIGRHQKIVGIGPKTIYQPGAGGSFGWSDVETGLGVVLCHNRMQNEFKEHDFPFYLIADAIRAEAAARA